MTDVPVWTPARLRVLRILFNAGEPLWALDVSKGTGLSYGVVYHSFRVLYDAGWAIGITEDKPRPGRPARVHYRLTAQGRAQARLLLGENT